MGTTFPPEVLWQNAMKSSPVKLLLIMIPITAEFSIATMNNPPEQYVFYPWGCL